MKQKVKTILTIVCVIVLVICVVISNKDKISKKETKTESTTSATQESNQASTEATSEAKLEKPTVQREYGKPIKIILNPIQVCESNEPVFIEYTSPGGRYEAVECLVEDAYISRELREEYKEDNDIYIELYGSVLDDDYTFTRDFYYMYVKYTVTNKGEENWLLPSALEIYNVDWIEGKYVGTDSFGENEGYNLYCYGGIEHVPGKCVAYKQTEGEDHLDGPLGARMFGVDETVAFELVYMVSEEFVEANNIYFTYSFGRERNADIGERYIRANIVNRGDYYDGTNQK